MNKLNNDNRNFACDRLAERISAFWDGELDPQDRSEIESHLSTCFCCQRYLVTIEQLDILVRSPDAYDRPFAVPTTARPARPKRRRHIGRFSSAWLTAATVALVLVGAIFASATFLREREVRKTPNATQPLNNLRLISQQHRQTQEMLRECLHWELRTIKLELQGLPLDELDVQRLFQRIDNLSQRLTPPRQDAPSTSGETI